MNSIDSSESEKNQEERHTSPTTSTENKDTDDNCTICLDKIQNKAFTDRCYHKFCFTCLVQWSKVKPECPLCKTIFRNIVYNVRSLKDFDRYHVVNPRPPERRYLQDNPDFLQTLLDLTVLTMRMLSQERERRANIRVPVPATQSQETVSAGNNVIPLHMRENKKCEKTSVDLSSDDECEIVYVKEPESSDKNIVNKNSPGEPIDSSSKTVDNHSDPCSSSSNNYEQEYSQFQENTSNSKAEVVKPQRSTVIQRVNTVSKEGSVSNSSSIKTVKPKTTIVTEFFYDAASKDSPKPKKRKIVIPDDVSTDNNKDGASSSQLQPKKQRVQDDIPTDDKNNLPIISAISGNKETFNHSDNECEGSSSMNAANENPIDYSLKTIEKKSEAESSTPNICSGSSCNIRNYEHDYCRKIVVKIEKDTDI